VIVKKSLQEGFGLGVTEGLWKAKPVVATRVGGHREQVRARYLADRHFVNWIDVLQGLPVGLGLAA
jgi:glycosyltransferase involved in cell wall biosynthesis